MTGVNIKQLPCLGIEQTKTYLIDTKPIPVVGYKRSKRRSEFRGVRIMATV